ncbi:hypothetical protein FGE12_12145 [Aggregicoccus sp. 17bor-14]|uniref:hypothetical protein n=1 Tax=Myxococcaceae TaxID=31 RepID=UPI00129C7438|nr:MULTISPECIES: hypothetical protein [Myxococcaceae]MBF5043140.1 hypothetical protein [Simulacricoccus sp. 17bor-14]MRI88900.1 hypothetical protein [Aggregicoccus sp. 17bor-14]
MTRPALSLLALLFTVPALAQAPAPAPAETAAPRPNELALAPSRFELPIAPGDEQTVVVNVISSGSGTTPLRLRASLGDWALSATGDMSFDKPGTTPRSATPWMLYSPAELSVAPGQTHPVRVTISVPKDAAPGDYTAVLFVEERPADLKQRTNTKQLMFHFRLAAIFYVMVPPFTLKGSLTGLRAEATARGLEVTPSLKNEGNTHLRPVQSFQVVDGSGKVVLEQEPTEAFPVLAGTTTSQALRSQLPAPGEYSLRYRVDFKDGGKVVEGRTKLVVPAAAPPAPAKKTKR